MSRKDGSKAELTPLQQALFTIEKLQKKLASATRREDDPIAIIGMGCRFPGGAASPAKFRELLWKGGDAVTEIPASRKALQGLYDPDPSKPGKMSMRRGAFVDGVDRFDAEFFRISRREAEGLDPQQRFFLEVSWEALEDAGIPPHLLAGTRTGVFAGVHAKDYAFLAEGGLEKVGAHYSTGVDASYVAGRLSYLLGLEGPSMAVDTACSSSLAAVHLACQSLRTDESVLAIAGGVKLILSPQLSVFLSKAGALSPSNRCRAFDRAADGMVQGEGCGVVILKRYRNAVQDGDRILATIRGTAMNHDGASGGLTVPNVRAQESLYRFALQRAGVEPGQVDYLEAHGTGTRLGDPIELEGVSRVYGVSRPPEKPLWIGSAKPNIGHTEAAAGIAGLIKAVLVLQAGEAPPSIHFEHPNPEFAWAGSGLAVPRERTPLAGKAKPHLAAVSSFGMSGVNAHALVEAYREPVPEHSETGPYLLPLSARTELALRELASSYLSQLETRSAASLRDDCFTAGAGRSHHEQRLALAARTPSELFSRLRAAADGRVGEGIFRGQAKATAGREAVFVFGDDGVWAAESLRGELGRDAAFRAHAGKIDAVLRQVVGGPVLEPLAQGDAGLFEGEAAGRKSVVLLGVQIALAELWRSYGVHPAAVAGEGTGALAAGVVAGMLSVEDAVRLILQRPAEQPVRPQPAKCPVLSISEEEWIAAGATVPVEHWARQATSSERRDLDLTAEHLLERNAAVFLTFGCDASLGDGLETAAHRRNSKVLTLRASASASDGQLGILSSAAQLYCAGFPIDFKSLYPGGRKTVLPTYPWQRERFWWDGEREPTKAAPSAALEAREENVEALQGLFCDLAWNDRGTGPEPVQVKGTWLVISRDPQAAGEWRDGLVAAGGLAVVASAGPSYEKVLEGDYRIDFTHQESFPRLLKELSASGRDPQGVIFRASSGHPETLEGVRETVQGDAIAVTLIVQALARAAMPKPPRLYLVTQGAQAMGDDSGPVSVTGAPLWGLGRVIAYEHPELRCKRIDVGPVAGPEVLHGLIAELGRQLALAQDDDEIALRGDRRLTPSFTRGRGTEGKAKAFLPRQDRTYLITGGLGGIGLRLASWLVARGARSLAVCGRTGETAETRQALDGLRAAGAKVDAFRVDVSRPEAVADMLATLRRGGPALGGIFHCAGVLADSSLMQLDLRSFGTVMGPKVEGAWNLHTLATDASIEQFVLFSSTASMIGAPGQANYAAANAFLDALANLRRARGLPATSLNWGSWGEVGMAVVDERRGERLADRGMAPMSVDEALAAMALTLVDGPATRGIARFDEARWISSHPSVAASSLFRGLTAREAGREADPAPRKLREVLLALEGSARHGVLEARFKEMVGEVSRVPPERLSATDSFDALGFDSIMALELRDMVTSELEVSLPLRSFVDESSIGQVTAELLEKLAVASVLGTSSSGRNDSKRVLL
ncbi:SDR family NAD(P)-dependent oxidoreductase [Stigmatella aurantiaca]|uniref:Polyketide synthase n=1 Tax=Stigmatella aurantiaca (strain DW4/3-1) TaxID=378806 RepID=B5X0I0_STIAD|nr:type I polyketide synthase [Stigmatella aurantiaca]ADO72617.1 Polyketide synthase type I [Stigmatella aurantiaca DW4/3-1]CAQ34917.1 TPA: polyketide synthase [Stigmatella aurantiaca DW4/3-1]